MQVFKLKFLGPLHVDSKGSGEPETVEEFIRSDTLSAALCLAWSAIYREDESIFLNPPFLVSSAFPYIGETLLFPVPVWNFWQDMDVKDRKKAKTVRWITQDLFEDVLSGKQVNFKKVKIPSPGVAVSSSEFSRNPAFNEIQTWVISERQRVSVERLGTAAEGNLFFFALQFFGPESGLYFLVDVAERELRKMRNVLNYLGDTGIGADRNSGLGHFRVAAEQEFNLPVPGKSKGWFTLSLFNPGSNDDFSRLDHNAAYDLTVRSGWISGSTIGRPPVRTFSEGSFFPDKPTGRVIPLIDGDTKKRYGLRINHSAPRDFRAFSLPCTEPPFLKEKTQ